MKKSGRGNIRQEIITDGSSYARARAIPTCPGSWHVRRQCKWRTTGAAKDARGLTQRKSPARPQLPPALQAALPASSLQHPHMPHSPYLSSCCLSSISCISLSTRSSSRCRPGAAHSLSGVRPSQACSASALGPGAAQEASRVEPGSAYRVPGARPQGFKGVIDWMKDSTQHAAHSPMHAGTVDAQNV